MDILVKRLLNSVQFLFLQQFIIYIAWRKRIPFRSSHFTFCESFIITDITHATARVRRKSFSVLIMHLHARWKIITFMKSTMDYAIKIIADSQSVMYQQRVMHDLLKFWYTERIHSVWHTIAVVYVNCTNIIHNFPWYLCD